MKIGLSIGFWGKEWEFFWGHNPDAKYAIAEISGTILTVKLSFYIKV